MNDAEVIAAIRARHLKANISGYEEGRIDNPVLHWEQAWLDPGGTAYFGPGPYVKLPITLRHDDGTHMDDIVIRVYPPKRLQERIAKHWKASVGGSADPERT